jgi:hypothetical protein
VVRSSTASEPVLPLVVADAAVLAADDASVVGCWLMLLLRVLLLLLLRFRNCISVDAGA